MNTFFSWIGAAFILVGILAWTNPSKLDHFCTLTGADRDFGAWTLNSLQFAPEDIQPAYDNYLVCSSLGLLKDEEGTGPRTFGVLGRVFVVRGDDTKPKQNTPPSATPTPSPSLKKLTRDDWVDAQYHGKLTDEAGGARQNFAMRLKSSGEPSGQPSAAAITGLLEFMVVSTEDTLAGSAIYADDAQVFLSGQTALGMLTLRGTLKGDRLTGTWEKTADGQTTTGKMEADRTGP